MEQMSNEKTRKVATVIALAVVALVSVLLVAPRMSDPATYAGTIAYLDQKKAEVLSLTATSTAASAALSVIPGDACTPIAEQLAGLSSNFLLVLSAIYLEKYLLTIIGFAAFGIVVPAACALFAAFVLTGREGARRLAWKLAVLGLAATLIIPAGVAVSTMIERTYGQTQQEEVAVPEVEQTQAEGEGNVLSDLIAPITGAASDAAKEGERALNQLIERLAVLIVTACLIPVLVLVFFVWLIKVVVGVEIDLPGRPLSLPRHRA